MQMRCSRPLLLSRNEDSVIVYDVEESEICKITSRGRGEEDNKRTRQRGLVEWYLFSLAD
jgi:hypothetical protein